MVQRQHDLWLNHPPRMRLPHWGSNPWQWSLPLYQLSHSSWACGRALYWFFSFLCNIRGPGSTFVWETGMSDQFANQKFVLGQSPLGILNFRVSGEVSNRFTVRGWHTGRRCVFPRDWISLLGSIVLWLQWVVVVFALTFIESLIVDDADDLRASREWVCVFLQAITYTHNNNRHVHIQQTLEAF